MDRKTFIRQSSLISLGFFSLQAYVSACTPSTGSQNSSGQAALPIDGMCEGFGPLQKDPKGILNLPKGFQYKVISRQGTTMTDGFLVPGRADGMATFPGKKGRVIIIRNHEVSPSDLESGPFGKNLELLSKVKPSQLYDFGRGKLPSLGGTTTLVYNPKSGEVEVEYLSLTGTIRNCAGGPTPWNSWITCEEDVTLADHDFEKNHGYNFEVPASENPTLFDPVPLKDMGRFNHEAVCVDPKSGIIYETEDRPNGLIYRFLPHEKGNLQKGGKLQVLAIKGKKSYDTRNWKKPESGYMEPATSYAVEWLDIEGVDSEKDDLRYRGFEAGAARFARGEGMWFGKNEMYFACTNGGKKKHGQIFRYTPSAKEGKPEEKEMPGTLELFVEPNNTDIVESCDNLTIAKNGDLIVCEDKSTPRIVGVTEKGKIYHLAKNVGFDSEFAGAAFSPDGNVLFVNIQHEGLTLAIEGPWGKRVG